MPPPLPLRQLDIYIESILPASYVYINVSHIKKSYGIILRVAYKMLLLKHLH